MVRLWAFLIFTALAVPACAADTLRLGDIGIRALADSPDIRLTHVTRHGYVGLTVPGGWSILVMQGRPPMTTLVFQIRDAESGLSGSGDLLINLLEPDTGKADSELADAAKFRAAAAAAEGRYKDWTLYTMQTHKGEKTFSMIDAQMPVADVICRVRISWTVLPEHGAGYDAKMTALFDTVLDSIHGQAGAYETHPGEVVRQPIY